MCVEPHMCIPHMCIEGHSESWCPFSSSSCECEIGMLGFENKSKTSQCQVPGRGVRARAQGRDVRVRSVRCGCAKGAVQGRVPCCEGVLRDGRRRAAGRGSTIGGDDAARRSVTTSAECVSALVGATIGRQVLVPRGDQTRSMSRHVQSDRRIRTPLIYRCSSTRPNAPATES